MNFCYQNGNLTLDIVIFGYIQKSLTQSEWTSVGREWETVCLFSSKITKDSI